LEVLKKTIKSSFRLAGIRALYLELELSKSPLKSSRIFWCINSFNLSIWCSLSVPLHPLHNTEVYFLWSILISFHLRTFLTSCHFSRGFSTKSN
jgi:hypothetical protein